MDSNSEKVTKLGNQFMKVSLDQFSHDMYAAVGRQDLGVTPNIKEVYESIQLPRRGTARSAGYDFYMPFDIGIIPGIIYTIPTGIRCQMDDNLALFLFPRSGLGFRYGMRLRNSVGITDADYFWAENEGHIMACFTTDQEFQLHAGDRFMQGVFFPYYITEDDDPISAERHGGFGSTGG